MMFKSREGGGEYARCTAVTGVSMGGGFISEGALKMREWKMQEWKIRE